MKTKVLVSVIALCSFVASAQKDITGFHHIESVASDGKFLYVADIGKELDPSAKDGDGRIIKTDMNGKILDSLFAQEKLNAPKGLALDNGILFVADVERLVALDIKSEKKLYEIAFEGISFLNDIAVVNKTTLFISATDKSKIFKVSLIDGSYTELVTDKTILGTNGLFYDAQSNRLYVNGFGSDNKPNGIFGYIDLYGNKFIQLTKQQGYFDGIWLSKGVLYISSWVAFEQKGIILTYDIVTGKSAEIKRAKPFAGPADFTIVKNQIIVPQMLKGIVTILPIK
jgi:hypothetical protein